MNRADRKNMGIKDYLLFILLSKFLSADWIKNPLQILKMMKMSDFKDKNDLDSDQSDYFSFFLFIYTFLQIFL